MDQPHIYLSFATADAESAQGIATFLRTRSYDVATAADAPPDVATDAWVASQIATCQAFVVLLSPDAQDSAWVLRELALALSRHTREPGFVIIPISLAPNDATKFPPLPGIAVVDGIGLSPMVVRESILIALKRVGIVSESSDDFLMLGGLRDVDALAAAPSQEQAPYKDSPTTPPSTATSLPANAPEPSDELERTRSAPQPVTGFPSAPVPPAPSAQSALPGSPAEEYGGMKEKKEALPSGETALDVAFRAYYPKEVVPLQWEKLLVYIMLDTSQALALAQADAAERLVRQREKFRAADMPGTSQLRKGAVVTLLPVVPGFECNPSSITARWEEDAQCHEFRVRAKTIAPGQAVNGSVTVLVSGVIIADIPISIFVQQAGGRVAVGDRYAAQEARRYRKIFASYSHKDSEIVQLCRSAIEATGDRFLQDVDLLRSGQHWNDALMQAITEADLFQLFWSRSASQSPHVSNEWHYALELQAGRPQFIRPVYWTGDPFQIPPELASLHFERLNLASMGARRTFWQMLFGRA